MGMGIRVDGFDEINRKLNKISNAAKKIERNNHIPFTELFSDSFIKNIQTLKLYRILLIIVKN